MKRKELKEVIQKVLGCMKDWNKLTNKKEDTIQVSEITEKVKVKKRSIRKLKKIKAKNVKKKTLQDKKNAFKKVLKTLETDGFGAGQCYEIYAERMQNYAREKILFGDFLNEENLKIAKLADFETVNDLLNPKPEEMWNEKCDKCDDEISEHELANSLNYTGSSLCSHCLREQIL